jgi:hypothetical protein
VAYVRWLIFAASLAACTTGPWYRDYGFASEAELREPSAVPGLIRALRSGDATAGEESARALARLGAPAVPALVAELRRGNQLAALALGEMGAAAAPAVGALGAALGESAQHMREAAARALGKIGPAARDAVPALLLALRDREDDVRRLVPPALVAVGQATPEVTAALERATRDPGHRVRHAARDALNRLRFAALSRKEPPRPSHIVAVFDVQDPSGQLGERGVDQLTEYLATQLAAAGLRVVPRAQLRARLLEEKKSSYRQCVDESCQIELGKAVAAQKTVATKILRAGGQCAVTAMLYDLKSEATERAASVDTSCAEGSLLAAMRELARKLTGAR